MRRLALLTGLILLAPTAAAQTTVTRSDTDSGMIGPDSMLYSVDKIIDDTRMRWAVDPPNTPGLEQLAVGLSKSPGEVVTERAQEAQRAAAQNDTDALEQALNETNRAAQAANGVTDRDGLDHAASVIRGLEDSEQVPDQATTGLQTALDQITAAQNRDTPGTVPDEPAAMGVTP